MSSAPPPKPPEQASPGPNAHGQASPGHEPAAEAAEGLADRRDRRTGVDTASKGDADVNTSEQGRFGDIAQNTTHQGYQQDR